MDRYTYTPLNAAKAEIRLIILLPGGFSDDIEIEIFHVESNYPEEEKNYEERSTNLERTFELLQVGESSRTPSYEAVSYAWGSEVDPYFISIRDRGRLDSNSLPVTQNLAEAMRYLRREDEARILWIDAVCINQQDLIERSVQVGRMADIFRNAKQVDVWLGPESASSDVAVNLVHAVAADLVTARNTKDTASRTVLPGSETDKLLANREALLPRIKALKELCQRQWFTRLWIYQEYHLATAAIAYIGTRTLDMRDLYKVLRFIYVDQPGRLVSLQIKLTAFGRAADILKPIQRKTRPLLLARRLKRSLCTDERDRVYAILGLIRSEYRVEIVPDYTKSLQEVNKELFKCMMKLQHTAHMAGSLEERQCGQPSWVPKLSQTLSSFGLRSASGRSKHEILYERADESLRLPAKAIGTVTAIWFDIPPKPSFGRSALETFRAHAHSNLLDSVYPLGGDMFDAYVCSLAGGRYLENHELPSHLPLQELRNIIQGGDYSTDTLDKTQSAFVHARGRAIFSTTDGLIGLCPFWGKIGDQIFVTPGVNTAIILSSIESQPNHYQLKGECYVHGLMNSEALLGALSAVAGEDLWSYRWERVAGNHQIIFKNGELTTQNDPRLGPLPEDWNKKYWSEVRRRYYDEEFGTDGTMRELYFHNRSTNKFSYFDPRMTSKALKRRGVAFEDIIII
ncbi:HET-domain-containing protein [Hyaloscypha bicolor E]|uniref:HET-domain-containing protein n=1 Tax=Hyaloscypha bicolor E TaxID=1095630 RepID=A0A2J6THF5_9HELO|nr:HET-domain-containing protein [Hyaloscypha bicolor E]PMD62421.1 HET-domain-containing protein [Hyaloscypha bicolor E]